MKGVDLLEYKDVMFLLGVGRDKAYEIIKDLRKETKFNEVCKNNSTKGIVINSQAFIEKYPNLKKDIKKLKEQQFNEKKEKMFT